jgi:hypothetical protein
LKTASDEALMLAYAKGKAAAFDELFARHGQKFIKTKEGENT